MALRGLVTSDVDVDIRKMFAAALEKSIEMDKNFRKESSWPVIREEEHVSSCPILDYLGVRQISPKT